MHRDFFLPASIRKWRILVRFGSINYKYAAYVAADGTWLKLGSSEKIVIGASAHFNWNNRAGYFMQKPYLYSYVRVDIY